MFSVLINFVISALSLRRTNMKSFKPKFTNNRIENKDNMIFKTANKVLKRHQSQLTHSSNQQITEVK